MVSLVMEPEGYYTGTIDGVAGDGTYNGLVKFQSANGLTPDGMAGNNTLSKFLCYAYFIKLQNLVGNRNFEFVGALFKVYFVFISTFIVYNYD